MANELIVGKLRAILGLDTAQFEAGARKASTTSKKLSSDFKMIGTAIGTFTGLSVHSALSRTINLVAEFGKQAIKTAGDLVDMSQKTGISTEALQRMDYVATQTGATLDDFTRAAFQLGVRLAGDNKSVASAVKELGLNLAELRAMSPEDQFATILEAMGNIQDAGKRNEIGMRLFGRAVQAVLPAAAEGYKKLAAAANVASDSQVKAIDKAADAWAGLMKQLEKGVIAQLGTFALGLEAISKLTPMERFQAFLKEGATGAIMNRGNAIMNVQKFRESEAKKAAAGGAKSTLKKAEIKAEEDHTEAIVKRVAAENEAARQSEEARDRASQANLERLREHDVKGLALIEELTQAYQDRIDLMHDFGLTATELTELLDRLGEKSEKFAEDEAEAWANFQAHLGDIGHLKSISEGKEQSEKAVSEIENAWMRMADHMTFAISDGFAGILVGLRGFKDSMIDIWFEIRRAIAGVLSQMLADFIGGYIRPMVAAMAGAVLGKKSIAGEAAAAAASGIGGKAGTAGGGVGALIGLASNPWTWAVGGGIALAALIGKMGLFRGGEEGTQVNPRRDQFFRQFGPGGTGPGSGFHNLASMLRSQSLFGALSGADTVREWEAAQSMAVSRLQMLGHKGVRSFQMGGFVPPGTTQLAILHGGAHGEDVVPRGTASGVTHVHNHFSIQGWDGQDIVRVVEGKVIPLLNAASQRNTGLYATEHRKGFGIRPAYGTR